MTRDEKLARCAYVMGIVCGSIHDFNRCTDPNKGDRLNDLEAYLIKECEELFYKEEN